MFNWTVILLLLWFTIPIEWYRGKTGRPNKEDRHRLFIQSSLYRQGVGLHSVCLAEAQRQAQEWQGLWRERNSSGGGLLCSGWCGQAGGELTRSRHPVWLVRVYFWLSWAGPKLEQGKNRGNCPFRTDFYRTYFSDSLDHSLDTAVWLPVSLTFGEPAGILGCSTDDGWFPEPAVQTVAQSSVWIRSAAPVHLDVQSVTTRWPSLTCNSHSLIESHLLPTGCHKESFVRE